MRERSVATTLKQLIYRSTLPPVFFLTIFALFMLAQFVHVPLISSLGQTPLMVSNLAFLLLVALRFLWHAFELRNNRGSNSDRHPRKENVAIDRPDDQIRTDSPGAVCCSQGEKRDLAQLGSTLIYGGLLLALLIGTSDNLRQYSGSIFQGVGEPMDLTDSHSYFSVVKGPLASTSGLPQLRVDKQILPCGEWPKGATGISLLTKKGAVLATSTVARGGEPFRFKGHEYYFNRFIYDVMFAIKTANGHVEFDDMIKMQPMAHPNGSYAYASRFKGVRYRWNAQFDPERKALRLVALDPKGAPIVDGVIVFQREPTKEMDGFAVQFSALSHWSQLHVVRTRHLYLLALGLLVAAFGCLLRLVYRRRRTCADLAPKGRQV